MQFLRKLWCDGASQYTRKWQQPMQDDRTHFRLKALLRRPWLKPCGLPIPSYRRRLCSCTGGLPKVSTRNQRPQHGWKWVYEAFWCKTLHLRLREYLFVHTKLDDADRDGGLKPISLFIPLTSCYILFLEGSTVPINTVWVRGLSHIQVCRQIPWSTRAFTAASSRSKRPTRHGLWAMTECSHHDISLHFSSSFSPAFQQHPMAFTRLCP